MSEDSNKYSVTGTKSGVVVSKNQTFSNDLISVRDIYLILRRGLPLIIVVSLLVAIVTFFYFSLKKDIFEASATAAVSPSGLDIRNANGISFSPQTSPSFETYKSLAYSDSVVISVLEAVKVEYPKLDIGIQAFKRLSDVEKIYGPLSNRPDTADRVTLAVSQKVKHENAAISVALTNAWTEKTIDIVRSTLSGSLNSIDSLTKTSLNGARENLEKSQEALKQASSSAALDILDVQLLTAGQHIADQKVRLSEAKTELAVAKELQDALLNQTTSSLSENSRRLLDLHLESAEADLDKAVIALQEFQEEHNLIALEARNIFLSIQLAEFEQLLAVAKASKDGFVQLSSLATLSDKMLQQALLDTLAIDDMGSITKIESEVISDDPVEQNGIFPKGHRIITEVETEVNPQLPVLENYVDYQALMPEMGYTTEVLENTIDALVLDLDTISSQFGPLKVEEARLQLTYELAEHRLRELLTERSRLTSGNEAFLIGLEAEVVGLGQQIELSEVDLLELQAERAEAQNIVGTLMIEVEAAVNVYGEIGGLEPTIAYLAQLAPLSAQVINLASQSLEPIGTGRSLPTALAFLLTAIIMTVLVFFREAIKV